MLRLGEHVTREADRHLQSAAKQLESFNNSVGNLRRDLEFAPWHQSPESAVRTRIRSHSTHLSTSF